MNDQAPDLLAQLRDIHVVAEPSWWPPSPGWWMLAALGLALAVLLLRAARRWLAAGRRRRLLLQVLAAIRAETPPQQQPREYLARLNRLFRVVALRAFPGTGSARLEGRGWVRFIAGLLAAEPGLETLEALAAGPYQPLPEPFNADALEVLARRWIHRYG